MKTRQNFKSLLGIQQIEIALLLKINRSQWSMFESGKRSLPTPALLALHGILEHMKQPNAKSEAVHGFIEEEKKQTLKQLEEEIKSVDYALMLLNRKIAVMEKRRNESLAALQLANYLATQEDFTQKSWLIESIASSAKAQLRKNSAYQLEKHKMKYATLKEEVKLLSELVLKMGLGGGIENVGEVR